MWARRRDRVIDGLFRLLNVAHRGVIRVSRGRVGERTAGMVTVELHTVGRRSGRTHSVVLTAPVFAAERFVLVASKGGDHRHPDWYRNLLEHPDAEATIEGSRHLVRCRTATEDERSVLWPELCAAWPGYARYQRRSDRHIPVVVCEVI